MVSLRPFLFALAIPVSLVACGGGGGDGIDPPTGPHSTSVAKTVLVPTNNNQARDFGLDLNDDKTVDNQLGMVLGTLAGQGFEIQKGIDEAVSSGSIILIVDFQAPNFDSTTAAGLQIKLGDMPMPAACTDPADLTTCGKHLDGSGSFAIAAGSPDNAAIGGKIAGGVFTGGPGDLSLQIVLGGAAPIQLDLIGARAKGTGITATGFSELILAGALTQDNLDTKVIPAVHAQLGPLITRDCPTGMAPPDPCGCAANSTGKTIIGLFDTNPKDCMVTIEEIKTNSLIQSLLAPDVTIDGMQALSVGIKVTTTGATVR
ncbi:MAG: hypothetical protein H6Q90_3355 [Deltaproteobacteria bacterium]|nr:hypothetical protein [Deltaproteobacteria bacterium]